MCALFFQMESRQLSHTSNTSFISRFTSAPLYSSILCAAPMATLPKAIQCVIFPTVMRMVDKSGYNERGKPKSGVCGMATESWGCLALCCPCDLQLFNNNPRHTTCEQLPFLLCCDFYMHLYPWHHARKKTKIL